MRVDGHSVTAVDFWKEWAKADLASFSFAHTQFQFNVEKQRLMQPLQSRAAEEARDEEIKNSG